MKHVLESWILNSTFCSYFSRVFSRILVTVWLSQHFWCLYLYTDFCEGFSVRDLANEYIYTIATYQYVKIFCIQSFSDPHFHAFGLNTEIYRISVFSPNAEKYRPEKLRIRTLFTLCIRFVSYLDLLSGFTAVALIVWCLIQEIWKISNKPLDRISCSCEHRSEGVLD